MNTVRFLVFADLHYYPGVFYSKGLESLDVFYKRAVDAKADAIIELGDFVHGVRMFPEIIEKANEAPLPFYHSIGNHETDNAYLEEVLEAYKMPSNYYYFDLKGFRFIDIDTNYYAHDGGFTHFQFRNYFDFPNSRETLPPEQIEWMEDAIQTAPGPCILISHASLEQQTNGAVRNHKEIMEIIRRANANGRKVMMSLNGHHHRDFLAFLENTPFFDVNSATFDWLSVGHECFPEELRKQYELIGHQVIWDAPLSAIVTVSDDGTIDIQGASSSYYLGISPEVSGNGRHFNTAGRPCTANILSANFKVQM